MRPLGRPAGAAPAKSIRAFGGAGRGRVGEGLGVARLRFEGLDRAEVAPASGAPAASECGRRDCCSGEEDSGVVRLGRVVARVSAREVVGRFNSACGRLELGARRGRAQGCWWAARAVSWGGGLHVGKEQRLLRRCAGRGTGEGSTGRAGLRRYGDGHGGQPHGPRRRAFQGEASGSGDFEVPWRACSPREGSRPREA
jgi:hypothetical protein